MKSIFCIFFGVISLFLLSNTAEAQGQIWAFNPDYGASGAGTIVKVNANADSYFSVEYDFVSDFPGSYPRSLMVAANDKIYGLTQRGGAFNKGLLFEFNPANGTYVKRVEFSGENGEYPEGGKLIQATNGKLYGTTESGGINGRGIMFEFDPITFEYTKLFDFTPATGHNPIGTLLQATNGKVYGMTQAGGINDDGVLFEYDIATKTYVKKIDLDASSGAGPIAGLIQIPNEKLYGVTTAGGQNDNGVVFEYDILSNTYTKKADFNSTVTGRNSQSTLVLASDGKLYGVTGAGGVNDRGTLFQFDPSDGSLVKKLDFDVALSGGRSPFRTSLVKSNNGKLYGLAERRVGSNRNAVLFEFDPVTSTFLTKRELSEIEGYFPQVLTQTDDGKLFGLAYFGGLGASGTLFEFNLSNSLFTKRIDFEASVLGTYPTGNLVAKDGKLYGATSYGGATGEGVLFEFDLQSKTYTKRLDLSIATSGRSLRNLFFASNGKLYGLSERQGFDETVVFECDLATNTCNIKIDFNVESPDVGWHPRNLFLATNGKLYGATGYGAANGGGAIFEYDLASETIVKKLDLINDGEPQGLVQGDNGKLYGTFYNGGVNNDGLLFEYDLTNNQYTEKIDFEQAIHGIRPGRRLIKASTGKIYGRTDIGVTDNFPSSFVYDPSSNSFNTLSNFYYPELSTEANNGKFYSMSYGVSEYDPITNSHKSKIEYPTIPSLQDGNFSLPLFIAGKFDQIITFAALPTKTYSSSSFSLDASSTSGLVISYSSSDPTIASINGNVVTIHKRGSVIISTNQSGNDTYNPAMSVQQLLTIGKGILTAKANDVSKSFGTENPALTISYTGFAGSEDETVLDTKPTASTIAAHGSVSGQYPITVSGGVDDNYEFNYVEGVLTVKANQTITFNPLPIKKFGDPSFDLTATSSSGLPVAYTSSDPAVAFIFGTTVTILKPGSVVISANQIGDNANLPASSVQQILRINENSNLVGSKLYGLTRYGGDNNEGILFEYNTATGQYTKKLDFSAATTGANPRGRLIQAANKKLYGLMPFGGANGHGVLFEYDLNTNTLTRKIDFSSGLNGRNPYASLFQASNGKLYGMTNRGGENDMGVLFEFDPANGILTKKLDFDYTFKGAYPYYNEFIEVSGGKLYGLTQDGGEFGTGILFEYEFSTNNFVKKIDFEYDETGGYPLGRLVDVNGKFYGIASSGGDISGGTLFEYDPLNNTVVKKVDFDGRVYGETGNSPSGTLVKASNGRLYGKTIYGGSDGNGVVFEFDPSNGDFATKFNISSVDGISGLSSLVQASDGKLFGSTAFGGIENKGILFTYDPINGIYQKKMDIASVGGANPYGDVIFIDKIDQSITFNSIATRTMGDPSFNPFAISSSGLPVSYSTTSDKLEVNGNTVTIVAPGRSVIKASQSGNDLFNAAMAVEQSFCINPPKPTVSVSNSNIESLAITSSAISGNQWYFNSTIIEGATSNTLNVTKAGTYKVQVRVDDCVSDFSSDSPIIVTGDLIVNSQQIEIYPNPVDAYLEIRGVKNELTKATIFDLTGRLIHISFEREGEVYQSNVKELSCGIYLLRLQEGDAIRQVKFMKR